MGLPRRGIRAGALSVFGKYCLNSRENFEENKNFYFGGCPFISFLWNRIVDNAHNAHYNIVKLTERRDAMNE
jgi:hypothetical protein